MEQQFLNNKNEKDMEIVSLLDKTDAQINKIIFNHPWMQAQLKNIGMIGHKHAN